MADYDERLEAEDSLRINWRPTGAPSDDFEYAMRQFQPQIRRAARRLIRKSPRAADLAIVYPGLLVALVTGRATPDQRRTAAQLIEAGGRLKHVARALDMPMWMRQLPASAFAGALPDVLPNSDRFARRISSRLPSSADNGALWLSCVLFAERAAGEDFAAWIAQQDHLYRERGRAEPMLAVLAAYAWYSSAPDAHQGGKLVAVPWRPEIGFETALCAAKSWFNRVRLVVQLTPGVIDDPWLAPGEARGHTFAPLLDHAQILAEAQAMQNCADQYVERIARHRCRLFSVQRNGARVATLEVANHPRESGFAAITQLKARHNMAASTEVWQAAYAWMAAQPDLKCASPLLALGARISFDQTAWRTVLAPYRAAKSGAQWIDAEASEFMFGRINADMADVARRAGVTSWLFT